MDTATIINRLLEGEIDGIDAKADFMRLRPEVRLFDRADKKDVILIDDTGPLYIGTLGPRGNWWRIAWLAPKSTGRVQRTELAKYYPDAETAAEHLVTVMQPWWQTVLYRRNQEVALAESWGDDKETIDTEAAKAEKPASPEQAEAGNYKKGHVSVQGIPIAIENARGSTRSGTNKQGVKWSVTMPAHYGYVKQSESKDGDAVDVYIGESPSSMLVFVINQKKEDSGAFDEHKCMLGFKSKEDAIAAYDAAFSGDLGPKLRDEVISCTIDQFKEWLKKGDTEKPFKLDESLRSQSARIIALNLLDIT